MEPDRDDKKQKSKCQCFFWKYVALEIPETDLVFLTLWSLICQLQVWTLPLLDQFNWGKKLETKGLSVVVAVIFYSILSVN